MENSAYWRTESRTVYSNDFKLRIVELASQPGVSSSAKKVGLPQPGWKKIDGTIYLTMI